MKLLFSLAIPFVTFAILYGILLFSFLKKTAEKNELYKVMRLTVIIVPLFLGVAVYFIYASYVLGNYFEQALSSYDYVLAMEIFRGVMTCIFVILALVCAIITVRMFFEKSSVRKRCFFICISVFVIAECLLVTETTKLCLDIKHQKYIVYEGPIYCVGKIWDIETVTLINDKGKRLISVFDGPNTGTYGGKVVYGKHSKRVVELTITTNTGDG